MLAIRRGLAVRLAGPARAVDSFGFGAVKGGEEIGFELAREQGDDDDFFLGLGLLAQFGNRGLYAPGMRVELVVLMPL